MKTISITLAVLALVGCQQQFRYPCQNPENWDQAECQRPICEVNRDCPDLIFKDNDNIKVTPKTPPPPSKAPQGECK